MSKEETSIIASLVGAVAIMMSAVAVSIVSCMPRAEVQQERQVPIAAPSPETPTIDYEAMVGIDPLTQQTMEERSRNNDLEWRVDKLENDVRRLNQIVLRIREVRIGEMGEVEIEEEDER